MCYATEQVILLSYTRYARNVAVCRLGCGAPAEASGKK